MQESAVGFKNNPASDPLVVVTACNRGYLPYVAAMSASLAASRAPSTELRLYILQTDVDDDDRYRIEVGAPGVEISWLDVDHTTYEAAGVAPEPLILGPHYLRCLMGTALPSDVRRCIYLDGDTVIRRDLTELWCTNLADAPVGAALDYFLPRTADAITSWRKLELDPEAWYFNSGVLLVDLERWRAEDIGAEALRTCLAQRDHLLAQGRWPQHDQLGLNVVLHRRWHRLTQDWNYLSEMELHEANIVHYCGGGKPGSPTCRPQFSAWFHELVDTTAWKGYRVSG